MEGSLKGITCLQCIACSVESVAKLLPLIAGGAEITVIPNQLIRPASEKRAIELLHKLGVTFQQESDSTYDFYLDCNGELSDQFPAQMGAVELTGTGTHLYQQTDWPVPVVSVDDSSLKVLETFYGTADGFIRAFPEPVKGHTFLLVGYGRVGEGIAYGLKQEGARVLATDIDPNRIALAIEQGIEATHLEDSDLLMEEATVVVTQTGRSGIITERYRRDQLAGKILANMGVDDEFGSDYGADEVLYKKVPLNFSLDLPTRMRFLDLIFYAHNHAVTLILDGQMKPGYNPFPKDLSDHLMNEWHEWHRPPVETGSSFRRQRVREP